MTSGIQDGALNIDNASQSRTNLGLGSAALANTTAFTNVLFTQTAAVTVANSNAQTTLLGAGVGSLTLAANSFIAGRTIRLKLKGQLSTTTGTNNLTVNIKIGSTTTNNSGAVALVASVTNAEWEAEADITCETTGTSGTVWAQGSLKYIPTNGGSISGINFGNTSTMTLNTTISNVINFLITWGTASSSNTITCTNVTIEQLN